MTSRSRTVSSVTLKIRRAAAGAVEDCVVGAGLVGAVAGFAATAGSGFATPAGSGGRASGVGSFGSSSNGRSNRFFIAGQLLQLFETVTQSLDPGRNPRALVGFDDGGVEAWVAGGGLELCRHAAAESSERRRDLDADDRIVRSGHSDVGQVGGPLRQN